MGVYCPFSIENGNNDIYTDRRSADFVGFADKLKQRICYNKKVVDADGSGSHALASILFSVNGEMHQWRCLALPLWESSGH